MVEDPLAKAEAHQTRVVELNQQVQTLEKEADQLRAQAAKNADSLNAQTPLEPLEDVDSINKELEEARRANVTWELWDRKQQVRKRAEEAELKASKLSAQMVARQEAKIKAIAESKLPVPGMSLGDGVVLLNDVPFDQASDGEKLLASTKMAMAANPTLRLVLIKDGSLLDKKAMESLAKIAEENNFQIWIERVEGSGKVGFVIEDGRVKTGN